LGNLERESPQDFTVCAEFDWMLELISLARHNHTHAAQAQNGHKEENAKKSAYHRVIKSSLRGLGNLKGDIRELQTKA